MFVAQKGREPKGLGEINAAIAAKELKCPKCGSTDLTEARPFNLMFKTTVGAVDTDDDSGLAYLRPETAQGIFVNFGNVLDTMRRKLPFGIAQIGKAFRNEITPGNFTFRTREFEQMEIEYFVSPGEDEAAHQDWIDARTQWYVDLGMRRENLRQREQDQGRAGPLRQALRRPRVPLPDGLERARGDRQPHRLRSEGAQPQPREPRRGRRAALLRSGAEEAHRAVRDRAVGGRRPGDAGVPVRRVRGIAGQGAAGRGAAKLRELVQSFVKSVEKRDPEPMERRRPRSGWSRRPRRSPPRCRGRCRELLGAVGRRRRNRIEVCKKVRGRAEKLGEEYTRTVLRLNPQLSPITVAVFPLKKNEPRLVETARGIKRDLQAPGCARSTTTRAPSASSTAGRTRWHAVLHDRRLPEPRRPDRDRA